MSHAMMQKQIKILLIFFKDFVPICGEIYL